MAEYKKMGDGVSGYVDGKFLHLKCSLDKAKGKASGSGKMTLTANTGGFTKVDDTDDFRISVMGGYKV
jgi:hypothetical protein